jgi:hypothetical protein
VPERQRPPKAAGARVSEANATNEAGAKRRSQAGLVRMRAEFDAG